jgi:hypothetical protein
LSVVTEIEFSLYSLLVFVLDVYSGDSCVFGLWLLFIYFFFPFLFFFLRLDEIKSKLFPLALFELPLLDRDHKTCLLLWFLDGFLNFYTWIARGDVIANNAKLRKRHRLPSTSSVSITTVVALTS